MSGGFFMRPCYHARMRRKLSMVTTTVLMVLCVGSVVLPLTGCAHDGSATSPGKTAMVRQYGAVADAAAVRVVAEWNACDGAEAFGTVRFSDYRRHGSDDSSKPYVLFFYRLTHPLPVIGHPNHFGVVVQKDTMETTVIGGA